MKIGNREIGKSCYVIAEAGVNHNGNFQIAMDLVNAARECGADAVKFQIFKKEILPECHLSHDDFRELKKYCDTQGITFLATPFDYGSADFLNELGVPAFKIASGFLDKIPFLKHVASFKKPMIVSTGMADASKIQEFLLKFSYRDIVLMHCISGYPPEPAEINLHAMKSWSGLIGFSDHTLGAHIALAAVTLGACIVEKHITLDNTQEGYDHHISLEPHEFYKFIKNIRDVEEALGDGEKRIMPSEKRMIDMVKERSIE